MNRELSFGINCDKARHQSSQIVIAPRRNCNGEKLLGIFLMSFASFKKFRAVEAQFATELSQ